MKTLAEKIAVMQAAERGEKIEYRTVAGTDEDWTPAPPGPTFSWGSMDYRVAPKKPREFVIVCDHRGCPSHAQEVVDGRWDMYVEGALKTIRVREIVDEPVSGRDMQEIGRARRIKNPADTRIHGFTSAHAEPISATHQFDPVRDPPRMSDTTFFGPEPRVFDPTKPYGFDWATKSKPALVDLALAIEQIAKRSGGYPVKLAIGKGVAQAIFDASQR